MSSLKQQHPQQRASWGTFSEFEFNSSVAPLIPFYSVTTVNTPQSAVIGVSEHNGHLPREGNLPFLSIKGENT